MVLRIGHMLMLYAVLMGSGGAVEGLGLLSGLPGD
jgi:hypothetical protein